MRALAAVIRQAAEQRSRVGVEPERLERLKDCAVRDARQFFAISSVTGQGVRELIQAVAKEVERHRASKLPYRAKDDLLVSSGSRL